MLQKNKAWNICFLFYRSDALFDRTTMQQKIKFSANLPNNHSLAHWSATVMSPSEKCREPILHYTIYYCILGNNKRPIDQSRIVKSGQNWSKRVESGQNWSKLVMTFLIQRPMRLLSEHFGT